MPELPEVEMVRRSLEPVLAGEVIVGVQVWLDDYLRDCQRDEVVRWLPQSRFRRVTRHGKYLYFILDELELEAHLGMTGRLLICDRDQDRVKHTHVCLQLQSGQELRFIDPRRFGYLSLKAPGAAQRRRSLLGIEPLCPDFTAENLAEALKGRAAPIKALLLDQKIIAGLGNIYADETLFRGGIHPTQPAGSLSEAQYRRLHEAIQHVITDALGAGGTSFSDYVDANGEPGHFSSSLAVYGREQQPCTYCATPIVRIKIGGRSACYCPCCQPPV